MVALSDIHIGNGAPTTWYQTKVHEPYLEAALSWILGNATSFDIQEVILLGDLVDTWTYPPSAAPPTMQQIIDANPNILGKEGLLQKVVAAVPRVTFLLGNHDGTLTQADIATLQQSVGPIELVDPVHVLTGSTGAKTVFTHGHLWTMFNAPDQHSQWGTLPIGHFVTRAFSYMMANRLAPGQTVADLPNMGYPNGFDLSQFFSSFKPTLDPDLATILLDYIAKASGMPETEPIVLPDGSTTTLAEAKQVYADLFTRWVAAEGGSALTAARSAMADQWGQYLAWFAQRLAIQQSADLVVMGHTHTPISGLTVSPVNYVNSGFECASAPDMPPQEFNFTVVDLDSATAQIMQIAKGSLAVAPAPIAPLPSVVISPGIDFSCYVRILNQGSEPLTLSGTPAAAEGVWVVPPPQTIPPGGRGDAWLQDYTGAHGSEGSFTYTAGGKSLPFSVSCPTGVFSNSVSGAGGNFVARSGSGDWGARGSVPWWGHPLQVIFTVQ